MATAAPLALDRGTAAWLFAAALATAGPHATELPPLLAAMAALFFVWGGWLWWQGNRLPNRWLLVLCVAAYTGAIGFEYRTLIGRDPGVAMLAGFMGLKILEIKSRRDAQIIVTLGYFLLLTHYFYSQSIPTGLWLLASCVLLTATLVRLSGGPQSRLLPSLRYGGLLIVQALPFMLVLYVLFPRVNGPLWGMQQDAIKARTGLSDTMSPGSIAELAQSSEIAFRARFEGTPPPQDKLYWRGPVMENYDGQRWMPAPVRGDPMPVVDRSGELLRYELTLEVSNQPWMLALDAPADLPPGARITPNLVVYSEKPIAQRSRFTLAAAPDYRFNASESRSVLERTLRLPERRNPRTLALAAQWKTENSAPEAIVAKALRYFREEPFVYTLRPPLLVDEPIDDFLFRTRRGFCEHYAAAFVVLMRAAGVPARVVGGYQGGERNPVDGYLVIRQSDAHAWAEVWIAGRGWLRVDPTAAVSPSRIEKNVAAALPEGEPIAGLGAIDTNWLRTLRFRWEAVNNAWNQWVLGYNPERQRELLSRLGLEDADWQSLGALLTALCGALMLAIAGWTLMHRPRIDPAQRQWHRALSTLKRRGIEITSWEAPMALAERVTREMPALGPAFHVIARLYCQARYGGDAKALAELKAAVAALS